MDFRGEGWGGLGNFRMVGGLTLFRWGGRFCYIMLYLG